MKYFGIAFIVVLFGCKMSQVPTERLSQFKLQGGYEIINDSVRVTLKNTLQCPVRIWVNTNNDQLKNHFDSINPITLSPLADSVLHVKSSDSEIDISFASRLGDTSKVITVNKVELPFLKDKAYKFIQGYNSTPTHNTDWSRYAMDFGLAIGDTICAATPGYVVGVIEGYEHGGPGPEWREYGNFITIYDPSTGLFTQYAHLVLDGSFVEVGDKIEVGQVIGISGMTGQTNIEHLHFNCLKPIHSQAGLISIPMDSIGEYDISTLKRNQIISN